MPPHMPCRHLNYYTCTHALKSVRLTPPTPVYNHSHIETHAYQVLHPYRCSDAVLASIPLSHHHSLAFNPSLRHLQSAYQRCKILPPAPKLSLQPSIPVSLLSCTTGETLGRDRSCQRNKTEKAKDGEKWEVKD